MTTANADPTPETPAAATPTTPTDAQPPATDAASAAADTPPAAEESATVPADAPAEPDAATEPQLPASEEEPPGTISPAITDPEVTERLYGCTLHGTVSVPLRNRIAADCANPTGRLTWDTVAAGLLLAAPAPAAAAILATILLVRFNVLADVSLIDDKPGQLQLAMRANEQTAKDAEAFVNALGIFDAVTVLRV